MSVKSFIAVSLVLVSGAAFAQAQLGTINSVQGIVTVTDGAVGGTTSPGSPINNGMRFVATSSGSAVIRLNNGCVVSLQPNQAVTILQSMTCAEQLAAVQPIGGGVGAAGGSFATGALA